MKDMVRSGWFVSLVAGCVVALGAGACYVGGHVFMAALAQALGGSVRAHPFVLVLVLKVMLGAAVGWLLWLMTGLVRMVYECAHYHVEGYRNHHAPGVTYTATRDLNRGRNE